MTGRYQFNNDCNLGFYVGKYILLFCLACEYYNVIVYVFNDFLRWVVGILTDTTTYDVSKQNVISLGVVYEQTE